MELGIYGGRKNLTILYAIIIFQINNRCRDKYNLMIKIVIITCGDKYNLHDKNKWLLLLIKIRDDES